MSERANFFIKQYQDGLVKQGVLTAEQLSVYRDTNKLAESYDLKRTDEAFAELQNYLGRLSQEDGLLVSRLSMLDTTLLNSISAYEDNLSAKPIEETFRDMFEKGLELEEPERTTYYTTLEEKMREAVISSTHTLHPTIFYSAEVREFIRTLTINLETFANPASRGIEKITIDLANPEEGTELAKQFSRVKKTMGDRAEVGDVRAMVRASGSIVPALIEFAEGALSGKMPLVPMKKVTIPQENAVEETNTPDNKTSFNIAMEAMLKVCSQFVQTHADQLSDEAKAAIAKIEKPKSEWRTWAFNADADGRPEAHLLNLIASTEKNIKDEKYAGQKLDMRQNASVIEDSFSALVQLECARNPEMQKITEQFFTEELKQTAPFTSGGKSFDPRHNIYQQLSEEDKTKFARYLLNQDIKLMPDGLSQDIEDSKKFIALYKDFLREKGLDTDMPTSGIGQLSEDLRVELSERMRKETPNALKLSTNKNNLETYWNFHRFLEGDIYVLDKKGEAEKSQDYDKKVAMLDAVRRLAYVSEVKERVSNPEDVCDRHQMANFESVSDFYNMLALMREAGAVEIKNGKVVRADMAIMPLLETIGDMKNGPEIFKELLSDTLARSLFEANGDKVSLMVGFSDGAKSGGNLASIWGTYKCTKEIAKLCKEHGFILEILEGRGPSEDRGGSMIAGVAKLLMSDEVVENVRFDTTDQADRPMRNAASPGKGERDYASAVVHTVGRAVEAAMRTEQEKTAIASFEAVWEFMAGVSSEKYRELARNNPVAKQLVMGSARNPDVTTRPLARAKDPHWDEIRAITTEHAPAQVSMSLHNVGLKEAMQEYLTRGPAITTVDGKTLEGMDALKHMYEHFEPFKAFVEIQRGRVERHHPAIVRVGCEAIGVEDGFAAAVNGSIDGLPGLLTKIANEEPAKGHQTSKRNALTYIGQAQISANAGDITHALEHRDTASEIIRNALTVGVMGHQEARPTPKLQAIGR